LTFENETVNVNHFIMVIGIPREIKDNEYRVGMIPSGVKALAEAGHRVLFEKGAGEGSKISDPDYEKCGGVRVSTKDALYGEAELIVKVKEPLPPEYELLRKGQVLFSFLHLAANLSLTQKLLEHKVSAIAYETVALDDGRLPLLKPMSEIAGRLAIQHGAYYLQRMLGGRGVLLSGVPGVERGFVVILGGGTVGSNSARMALGLGARVLVLDVSVEQLRLLEESFNGRVETEIAHRENIRRQLIQADVVVGAVLVSGAKAPTLVDREMLGQMKEGSVVVDVAIDQGGIFETSRPTSHSDPVFEEQGILHYCVPNIPGAVPRTSTYALANMTLPYVQQIAGQGLETALRANRALEKGLNTHRSRVTHRGVAQAHGMKYESSQAIH
jgi:alanine dehydrogenase